MMNIAAMLRIASAADAPLLLMTSAGNQLLGGFDIAYQFLLLAHHRTPHRHSTLERCLLSR
jgi:hypothetical protein